MEDITYKIDQYEGPLDLLLALIAKNKVSIIDIPIAVICDQYMQYMEEAQKMDLEIASEFIVMASELMLIKSRMLLPRDEEDEEDPRAELIDALLLYQKAKEASEELKPLYQKYSGRMIKEEDEIPPEKGFPLGLDPALLSKALHAMLHRLRLSEQAPAKMISPLIQTKVVNVEEKIEEVVQILEMHEEASLFFLLKNAESRPELLATFMGILELIKLRRIFLCEEEAEDGTDVPPQDGLTLRFRLNHDYIPPEPHIAIDETNDMKESFEETT